MKKQQAETALTRVRKVCGDLKKQAEVARLLGSAGSADAMDQAVTELGDVARALHDEITAMAKYAKNYRVTIQHGADQPAIRDAYANSDTAVENARRAYEAGATVAQVRRATDDVVIYDGPAGTELPMREW